MGGGGRAGQEAGDFQVFAPVADAAQGRRDSRRRAETPRPGPGNASGQQCPAGVGVAPSAPPTPLEGFGQDDAGVEDFRIALGSSVEEGSRWPGRKFSALGRGARRWKPCLPDHAADGLLQPVEGGGGSGQGVVMGVSFPQESGKLGFAVEVGEKAVKSVFPWPAEARTARAASMAAARRRE